MNWVVIVAALHPAEELWQAVVAETYCGLKQICHDANRPLTLFVQCHTVRDQRIVMRPYRAAVIAERIKDRLALRHGAPAPPAEHVVAHQAIANSPGAFASNDARPEQMASI